MCGDSRREGRHASGETITAGTTEIWRFLHLFGKLINLRSVLRAGGHHNAGSGLGRRAQHRLEDERPPLALRLLLSVRHSVNLQPSVV
jgi:hypothetical protein